MTDDGFRRLRQEQCDAIAATDPAVAKRARKTIGEVLQFTVGSRRHGAVARVPDQRDALGLFGRPSIAADSGDVETGRYLPAKGRDKFFVRCRRREHGGRQWISTVTPSGRGAPGPTMVAPARGTYHSPRTSAQ